MMWLKKIKHLPFRWYISVGRSESHVSIEGLEFQHWKFSNTHVMTYIFPPRGVILCYSHKSVFLPINLSGSLRLLKLPSPCLGALHWLVCEHRQKLEWSARNAEWVSHVSQVNFQITHMPKAVMFNNAAELGSRNNHFSSLEWLKSASLCSLNDTWAYLRQVRAPKTHPETSSYSDNGRYLVGSEVCRVMFLCF